MKNKKLIIEALISELRTARANVETQKNVADRALEVVKQLKLDIDELHQNKPTFVHTCPRICDDIMKYIKYEQEFLENAQCEVGISEYGKGRLFELKTIFNRAGETNE